MDVNPMDHAETSGDEAGSSSLTSWVAVTIALLATFMGICKVKDDNIVQAMQAAQADKLDHWNFYQARNIREEVANAALTELRLGAASAQPSQEAGYQAAIEKYQQVAADQNKKKADLQAQAEQDQKTYDALNYRDDQFDLSDAMLALAISLLAITALTRKRWLFWAAMVPTVGGVLMGLAGLMGWALHPDAVMRLFS